MGVALLVVPIVNKLAFFQMEFKEKVTIPFITSAVRNSTNHYVGEEDKPSLCKLYVDPNDGRHGSIETLIRETITVQKDKWALEWKITDKERDDVFDATEVRSDKEVARRFFKILKATLKESSLKVEDGTKLARVRVLLATGEDHDQVESALQEMDVSTIIILEYAEHEEWIANLLAKRAWSLLGATKKVLNNTERSLKASNKTSLEWKKRSEEFESKLKTSESELQKVKAFIWKEGPRIFEKVLQIEGYLVPKRRKCKVCDDSKSHDEPSVIYEEIDMTENVEERCPIYTFGQRCEQCAQSPPDCFSNEKVLACKWVSGSPCKREHFGPTIPPHTRSLHSLDHEKDFDLIQKLVDKHGIMNYLEYDQLVKETILIEDEM